MRNNLSLVNNITGVIQDTGTGDIPEFLLDNEVDPDTIYALASFTNRKLIFDWDTLVTIEDTLSDVDFPLHIKHIKSHQDNTTPYDALPFHAQLNVDADALATQYQEDYGSPKPTAYRFPKTRAQLLITGGSITYQFKSNIRYASSGAPAMETYLCSRNRWTRDTLDTIDWDANGASLAREAIPRTQAVKLVHGILPTNYRVSQYSDL